MLQVDGLRDKVALVTGAAGDLGRAIVDSLFAQGARVIATDIDEPALEGAVGMAMDVSSPDAVEQAFAEILLRHGPVQILILNAGILRRSDLLSTDLQEWRTVMSVNLDGAFLCARAAVPHMQQRGWGRVVGIASTAGLTGGDSPQLAYAASKAGLMTLTRSIAKEYGSSGITANSVAPGAIQGRLNADLRGVTERIPLGRMANPSEVADLVTFLSSDNATYINGEVVDINGGFYIN